MQENKNNQGVMVSAVIAILVVVGYGGFKYFKNDSVVASIDTTVNPTTTEPVGTTQPAIYMYKDGEYSAIGSYYSPAGAEEINISLTLKDDFVTAVTVTPKATNPTSQMIQTNVSNSVSAVVVGKKISSLNLGKVSGSSLTPKGFNDAVAKIKVSAKA